MIAARVELKTARAYAAGWVPEGKESRDGPVERAIGTAVLPRSAVGIIAQLGYNILRFFADYAAKKWPLFGAAEVRSQGRQKNCSCSKACGS